MEPLISSDLIRGHVDTIILHSLSLGDKSAQQIISFIEEKSKNAYQLNQATLYSSLKRLEGMRYLTSYWHDCENGRRKFFQITESGNQIVNQNLSNWSYSKAIIDKLMDVSIVENAEKTEISPEIGTAKLTVNKDVISSENQKTAPIEPNFTSIQNPVLSEEKEINFRNIINGLVSSCKTQTVSEKKEVLEPIKQEFQENLNDSIDNKTALNYEYVDLSSIVKKSDEEGLKVRVSSKFSATNKGILQINKVNFASSVVTALLTLIEFFLFVFLTANFKIKASLFVLFLVAFMAFPITMYVKYRREPYQCLSHKLYASSVTTALIICFNVIFIDVALNLLFNVDFGNVITLFYSLILPIVLSVNSVIFYVLRLNFSKDKRFNLEKNN